ncbi:ABC transporter ATP-binding protein [Desulfovibrio gilichinskyi]|uniref:Iron complex transport system ATP-binding protein n=1 Tax=Desulfovibrio gilichinskyi TaxID=1519643 RepID=A0A1X7EZ77_9BACT|nr:ABC transporter ATP-binding protein [Desulfovibrio gilichinskyi]SMF42905.1 iron complex transport system ATP-binding protein [Desulfovibrio gilichinskyi]
MITVQNLSAGYGKREVLQGMNLSFPAGSMTAVLGPNGSGKTTLVSSLSGVLCPISGKVEIAGKNVRDYRPRELAGIMAVLPQKVEPAFGLTVKSMVMMGRYAHGSGFFGYDSEDEDICGEAIRMIGINHLIDRPVSELSGGEFQRVLMARTVSQQAKIMVLDEAASGVDVAGKIELFDMLKKMNRQGATIICVIHDLNLAALYFDRLVFLSNGKVKLDGSPAEVVTKDNISNVYKTSVSIVEHPQLGVPQVLFSPSGDYSC